MPCYLDKHPWYLLSWVSVKIKWVIYIKFLEPSLEASTAQMLVTIVVIVITVVAVQIGVFS